MARSAWQRLIIVNKDARKSADSRRSSFKPRLELLEDRVVMSNFQTLANFLGPQLSSISAAISTLVGNSSATLPVVNQKISDGNLDLDGAIDSFQNTLTTTLGNIADNVADQVAQAAIDAALGGIEKGPSVVHIKTGIDTGSTPQIDVKLHLGKTLVHQQSPTFGIGIPSLPFKAEGAVSVDVGFDLPDVDLGLDQNGGFFINFNHSLDLSISAGLVNANLTGELGFLTFSAATKPGTTTGFNGTLSFNLFPPGQPGVIVAAPKLTGSANVDLMLNAGFTGALVSAPSISSEFVVDWKFADSQVAQTDSTFGSDLTVKFVDVQVSLGSYLTQFLSPVITKVQQFTSPFKDFFEKLGEPIPVLSDLAKVVGYSKGVSILDLAGIANSAGLIPPEYSALVTIGKEVVKITNIINQIEQSVGPGGLDNAKIRIGDIDVVGSQSDDLRDIESAADKFGNGEAPDWSNLQNIASSINVQPIKDQVNKLLKGSGVGNAIADGLNDALDALQQSINNIGDNTASLDLSFPFYDNPVPSVFGLLIGKDTDLVSFTAKAVLDGANSIPVFNYEGFEVDITCSIFVDAFLNLGYDTKGLREFVASAFNDPNPDATKLLDGFNLDAKSHLQIGGSLGIKGGFNATFLQAFVEGHLDADILVDFPKDASGFAAADTDHDGRIRGAEFLDPHLMEINGELSGGLDLDFVEGVKPLALEQKINIAEGTIASFNIGFTNPFLPPPSVALATLGAGGVLTLNIGPNAAARNLPANIPAPPNESYLITGDPNDPTTVFVSALGFSQTYKGVKKIVAFSGAGDDTIVVDASVAAEVALHGGDGAESYSALGSGKAELWGGLVTNGKGHNTLIGGKGLTILHAGGGADELHAGAGDATLFGGTGNDRLYGGAGTNHLFGGQGNDELYGGTGLNFITGGQGNDILVAGPKNDTLTGGAGDNLFIAGAGHDTMTGGLGHNSYVWKFKDPTNNAAVSAGALDIIGKGIVNTVTVYGGPKNDVFSIAKTADPQFPVKILAPNDAGGLSFTPIRIHEVENFDIEGRGGADSILVNELTNERVVNVGVDLEDLLKSNFGLGDGAIDHIIVNSTQTADNVTIDASTVQVRIPTRTDDQGITGGVTTITGIPEYKVSVANVQDDLLFNALNGSDTVNVLGISGPTRLRGNGNLLPSGADNDVFNVTVQAAKKYATELNIDADLGSNALHVSEPTTSGDQFNVTTTRIVSGLLPAVNFKATGGTFAGGVSLTTGSNNDVVNVQSTLPGVNTSVNTGGGNDQVNVSSTLNALTGIQGPLAVELGAGASNMLKLDNTGGATASPAASILANTVTGFAGPNGATPITYHATLGQMMLEVDGSKKVSLADHFIALKPTATLKLIAGAGNDTIDINGLVKPATVTTDAGLDTVNVGANNLNNLQGQLNVVGNGGLSVLNINDVNAPANTLYGLGATAFVRVGSSPIVFDSSVKALNVRAGNLNDHVILVATPNVGGTTVIGGNGQNTFTGPNADTTWQITGNNAGAIGTKLIFTKFQNLHGGSGADTFAFKNGQGITGTIDGGAGANTLDYSAYTTPINVNLQAKTASHTGGYTNVQTFNGGSASDTLVGTDTPNTFVIDGVNSGHVSTISLGNFAFKSIENLTGGASVDSFQFGAAGRLDGNVNGMGGVNILDYSQLLATMGVVVNLKNGTASRIGGTVTKITNVNGGAGDDILIGDDNGDVLKAGSGNTILIGGTGADTLIAGSGRDILIGGAGADTLTAGAGDDILIAGTTTFGTNLTPLQAILAEWKSNNVFPTRRQHLLGTQTGGLNGTSLLADATVANDVSPDTLNAGAGNDWFWGLGNEIVNAKPGDKIGSQP